MISLITTLTAGAQVPAEPGYDIIVVAGQSNATGYGLGDPQYTGRINNAIPRVLQLGRWSGSNMQLIPAVEPLHHWDNLGAGRYGFGLPFAAMVADVTPVHRTVVVVPAALGGSSILEWDEIVEATHDTTTLYTDMIARVQHVLSLPGTNRVVAFAWQQGETDVLSAYDTAQRWYEARTAQQMALHYVGQLGNLIARVRRDIPGTYPILVGQTVRGWPVEAPEYTNWLRVGQIHTRGVRVVSSLDLAPNTGQTVHFSAYSQTLLGIRYFNAWNY